MPPRAFLAAHRDPSMPAAAIGSPAVPDRLGALWADMAAHQSRIEEVLFEDKTKTSNPMRAQIITEVNSMMMICAEFQAAAAGGEGALQELRHQLSEARREAADLRVRVAMGAAASGPPRSYADVVAGGRGADVAGPASGAPPGFRAAPPGFGGVAAGPADDAGPPGHLAFLTPIGDSRDPSGDVLTVLKSNVDPSEAGIGEVDLRSTRLGVTVVARDRATIVNLKQAIDACPVTRLSMTVRVPEKRKPHVRLVVVDPEVSAANLISALNGRNPGLELDAASKVKSTFKERGGNNSHILELSPPDFRKLMTRQKVCVGWTSARVVEDIHTCLAASRFRTPLDPLGPRSRGVLLVRLRVSWPTRDFMSTGRALPRLGATPVFSPSQPYGALMALLATLLALIDALACAQQRCRSHFHARVVCRPAPWLASLSSH
ncbi:hypothetical protein HPB49_017038 [Dermacentor silvarum]|uniref:Uncharacterized protein n=1 Tax=Dermacentor silvarum TaxID=543639 RepID=A0ACB8C4Q1_DERSI|nr:hypothetical protein HPB49_017038 [Dermacentor silvarum]